MRFILNRRDHTRPIRLPDHSSDKLRRPVQFLNLFIGFPELLRIGIHLFLKFGNLYGTPDTDLGLGITAYRLTAGIQKIPHDTKPFFETVPFGYKLGDSDITAFGETVGIVDPVNERCF